MVPPANSSGKESWSGAGNQDEMSVSGYLTKNPEGTPVHSRHGDIYTVPSGRNFVLTTINGYQQSGHYVRYRIPGKNWAYVYNYHTSNTDYIREVEMHFPPQTQIDCEGWNRCAWSGYHYAASAVVDQ